MASDTLSLKENALIGNNFKHSLNIFNYTLLEENYAFNGFLVLKFKSESFSTYKNFYKAEVFWVNDLNYINSDSDKVYYEYISDLSLIQFEQKFKSKVEKKDIDYFLHFYQLLNKSRDEYKKPYLFGNENNNIDYQLFKNVNWAWNDGINDYLIFETSFKTAVIFSNKEVLELRLKKLFLPISDLHKFNIVNESKTLQEMGFTKKEIFVKFGNK